MPAVPPLSGQKSQTPKALSLVARQQLLLINGAGSPVEQLYLIFTLLELDASELLGDLVNVISEGEHECTVVFSSRECGNCVQPFPQLG